MPLKGPLHEDHGTAFHEAVAYRVKSRRNPYFRDAIKRITPPHSHVGVTGHGPRTVRYLAVQLWLIHLYMIRIHACFPGSLLHRLRTVIPGDSADLLTVGE